jgi:hypothetical protein
MGLTHEEVNILFNLRGKGGRGVERQESREEGGSTRAEQARN